MKIAIGQLKVRYGRQVALPGIDLALEEGVTGLLGPNGAGKSTLMKVLATLLTPQQGQVQIGPWSLPRDQQQVRGHLGYLPQEFGLPGNLSGREYLRYAATLKGAAAAEADQLLAEVRLAEVAARPIGSYSGGMKQRLAIAQALLGDPDLLIVDEPTAGLDPQQRTHLRGLIARRRSGRLTLFSTHVVADLDQVADRVVVLHQGQVRFAGTLEALADRAAGRVWSVEGPAGAEVPTGATLVSERRQEGRLVRRLLAAARPHPAARRVEPTAEEGYLYVISVQGPKGGAW